MKIKKEKRLSHIKFRIWGDEIKVVLAASMMLGTIARIIDITVISMDRGKGKVDS